MRFNLTDIRMRLVQKSKFGLLSIILVTFFGTVACAQVKPVATIPYEIAPIVAPFEMIQLERPTFPNRVFNIVDFGAKEMGSDKSFKSTEAIHRAIDAAHAVGGGKVLIPAGNWLTGPIHLRSNIHLHISEGSTVYFSEDKEDYLPVVIQRYEGVEVYNYSPLIYAYRVRNVAITGKGVLDGQAGHWLADWTVQPRAEATKVPLSRRTNFGKGSGTEGMRPNFVVFWESEDLLIEGITVNNGPMWNLHLVYSQRAIIRDVTINSRDSHNGDGIVIDSSRDVLVEHTTLSTGDDAIVIKSGFNEEGLEINIPTENVVIRHFHAYRVVTGSGGVVFGSETSGGIRNIYVHNALFEDCDRGIRFKTARGRGNVTENIYIRDIEVINSTYEALNFNTFYTGAGVGPAPLLRNIDIRNIRIDGVPRAIVLNGLPEKWLEDIYLENIEVVNAREGIRLHRVKNLNMRNVSIQSEERAMVAHDVYELYLDNVSLSDKKGEEPIRLEGKYTGVVVMPNYEPGMVSFDRDVKEDVIRKELPTAAW
ncbi:glycoside hydrolase family 28 protein [Alkalitalea saponilacus]|uniref:Glycosyl hydrolases family 28 n=1 Tax=Alkalitalea saponilacus TaxID=889453 RepID=A0A1T5BFZ4_9BACT|nr:glycoside hydrolase family 28 protein [Alkalitalea saponilacus]SKB46204.1 Glycosyl hydrolases family 28 [Alkalitalea saponilacus]